MLPLLLRHSLGCACLRLAARPFRAIGTAHNSCLMCLESDRQACVTVIDRDWIGCMHHHSPAINVGAAADWLCCCRVMQLVIYGGAANQQDHVHYPKEVFLLDLSTLSCCSRAGDALFFLNTRKMLWWWLS